jgi:hypothetical protein
MLTKIITLSLFVLVGCGKDVTIPNHLEKHSSITEADALKSKDDALVGMLKRGNSDIILSTKLEGVSIEKDDKTYAISKYHSVQSFNFINSLPKGSRVSVKFKGKVKTDEVVLKSIE